MQRVTTKPAAIDEHQRAANVVSFEDRLSRDLRWAMGEGSLFFEDRGAVQTTLRKITKRLTELGIPYAVVGGMALFVHGLRRFTEDVDLLVTPKSLREIHDKLDGLGFVPPFTGSKNLRDTDSGVKIEFLVTGAFPGDGKPKPVAFPDPSAVSMENNGVRYINLPTLIELKLASGMTNPDRMKDLVDVLELVKILNLPREFSTKLNPYVHEKYDELWRDARPNQKRYVRILRPEDEREALDAMLADGVTHEAKRGAAGTYYLVTTDPDLARKHDMHDETEFMIEPRK
ncbi:MAG: nucleotidyl transferase AbiEii/AbiGii toxin family protein [Planctomycetes bacterium]|nr:nucleotidyl transferase AbiEii/AbiGii toxin family protein [Planctomycetota bacterium]